MKDPGEFNRRVRIRTATRATPDGGGGFVPGEPTEVEVWAKIEPLEGEERTEAMQTGILRPYRITTRYRPGLDPAKGVAYRNRVFDVKSVVDPMDAHEELQIMVDEVLPR